jgi:uncharacterized protein YndB with AHSA1/START domain
MKNISLSRRLPYPVEMVWLALTDSEQLASWLMPNDLQPIVGHTFQFRSKPSPGFDGIVDCEVLEISEPERLVISWNGGGIETVVTFELSPIEGGTLVELTHDGFKLKDLLARIILSQGWKSLIGKKLPSHLQEATKETV